MRIQSLALATTVSLLASSTIFSGAQAQKGITLQPQTAWAVKKVNKDTPNAYCALARRFKQNMIMTIAQNSKNETSVAFDFSNSDFDTSRVYDITLDPGAGQQREYKFKPASSNAFVVRVGRDGQFLKSLNQTGYLRVDLDGQTYNFNLADIDTGTAQLDACIASSILPAAGDESPLSPMPSPPVSSGPQIAKLEAEKKRLEQKLVDLERENKSLELKSAEVSTANTQIDVKPVIQSESAIVLQKQVDDLKAKNSELLNKLSSFDSAKVTSDDVSVIELARENQRLKEELETLKTDVSSNIDEEEVRRLTAQISRLENDNVSLSKQVDSFSKDTDVKFLKQNILALKSENDALRLSLESDKAAQGQYSQLQQELDNIKVENDQLDEKIHRLVKEKNAFADQLRLYEGENENLKEKVSSKDYDAQLLENLRSEIKNIERKSADEIARKEREISSLEIEISALKDQNAGIENAEDKIATLSLDFDAKVSALRIKNEALKDELISLSKENADIVILRDKADTLILEKEQLGNTLQEAERKISILEGELESYKAYRDEAVKLSADIKDIDKQVLNLESANFELREKLEKVQQEKSLSENEEILNLQEKIKSLSDLNAKMEEKLTALENSNADTLAALEQEKEKNQQLSLGLEQSALDQDALSSLQNENKKLLQDLSSLKTEKTTVVSDLEKQIQEFEQKNAALNEQLEQQKLSAVEIKDGANEQAEALKQQMTSLKDALEQEKEKNQQLSLGLEKSALDQDVLSALQNENEKLLQDLSFLKTEKTTAVSDLEKQIQEFEQKNAALNEQLEQQKLSAVEIKDSASEQAEALKLQMTSLQETLDAFDQENKDLKLAIANSDEFNKTLQKDWSESLQTIEVLRAENARYEGIVAENEIKLEQQGLKISELQEKNADLTAELEEQTNKYLALVKDVEEQRNAGNFVNASIDDMTDNARAFEALKAQNDVLEDEVLNLQRMLQEQKRPAVVEASVPAPAVKPKAVKALEKVAVKEEVVKDAPYTSQEEQARRNIETMQSAARDVEKHDMSIAEQLAAMEPAAGVEEDTTVSQTGVQKSSVSALDGRPYEELKKEKLEQVRLKQQEQIVDDGLTEAQRLEERMRNQISEPPAASIEQVATVPSVEKAELPEPTQAEVQVIDAPRPPADENVAAKLEQQMTAKKLYQANVDIQQILGDSGIGLKSDIKTVAKHSDASQISYQWMSSNDLYGSAQQMPINNPNDFDNYVRDYLTMTEQRCTGDFAIIPAMTSGQGQTRVDSYEIACVGAGVDSSASVVFFSKNGTFTILAHEAPTEGMETAMEARDKIVSVVSRS